MKIIWISVSIVIVDQISKLLVKGFSIPLINFNYEGMYYGQSISVIGDFFRLTYIENPGMAFGIDPGESFKLAVSLFSLIASIGLFFYLYLIRLKSFILRLSIACILGGAIGNLIDRAFYGVLFDYAPLFYGRVVDFFDFDFFDLTIFGITYTRWPIFNIADASVTIGVLILIIFYKNEEEQKKSETVTESVFQTDNLTDKEDSISSNSEVQNESSFQTIDEQTDNGKKTSDKGS